MNTYMYTLDTFVKSKHLSPHFFAPSRNSWSLLGFLRLFGFGCLSLLVGLVLQLLGCWVSAMGKGDFHRQKLGSI